MNALANLPYGHRGRRWVSWGRATLDKGMVIASMLTAGIIIIWISMGLLGIWGWAKQFGEIPLGIAILAILFGPWSGFIWGLPQLVIFRTVIWKRKSTE